MRKSLTLSFLFIFLITAGADEIKVPLVWRNPKSASIQQVGFYQDKDKYIWALSSEHFKNLEKKKRLSLGIYINLDNDKETGRFPGKAGYDVQFNIKLMPVQTIRLRRWEAEVKSPFKLAAYQDDYVMKIQGDVLYFGIKKSILAKYKMGEKYAIRLLMAGYPPVSFTVNNKALSSKTKTIEPAMKFISFGENISVRRKSPYAEIISDKSGVKVWNSFMERYEPREKFPAKSKKIKVLTMNAARGESESLQLGITSGKVPRSINLNVSDLISREGNKIPASQVDIKYVGYVINSFDKSYGDVLLPAYRRDDALNNFILLTVTVPVDAKAGVYSGKFDLKVDGKSVAALPLNLQVYDFSLPEVPSFPTAFCIKNAYISGFFKAMGKPLTARQHREQWEEMRNLCRKYRIGPRFLGAQPELTIENQKLKIDWSEFDKGLENFFKVDKFALFQMTHYVQMGSHGRKYPKPPFFNKKQQPDFNDPLFQKLWPQYIKALYDRLKKRNYLNRTLFVIWDEPYSTEYKNINMLSKLARQAAPDIKLGVFIERYEEKIAKSVDIWLTAARFMGAVYKRGEKRNLWLYNDHRMGSFINPASDIRGCFWQAWHYKIQGFLNSEVDAWTWGWPKSFDKYHNVAGAHMWFYPDIDGGMPHASLRLALIRDGLNDYEYLKLFAAKLASARTRKNPGLMEAEALWTELQKVMPEMNKQKSIAFKVNSIAELDKWRDKIAAQIIKLSK
jgi:hypothetical protein